MKDKFCVKKKNVAADCRHFLFRAGSGTGISGNNFTRNYLFYRQLIEKREGQ